MDSATIRVLGGEARYGGATFRPKLDASYLNGKVMVFGLYYVPTEPIDVNGVMVAGHRWNSDLISLWGTQRMLEIMEMKGWADQWKQEDIDLLRHPSTGSRLGMIFWRKVGAYS